VLEHSHLYPKTKGSNPAYGNTFEKRVLIVFNMFQGLAKSLEQPEVKEWLALTKDTLMGDKPGKEQDEEAKKLNGILKR
jgi:hypothetical protein